MNFGKTSGSKADKLADHPIPMQSIEGCSISIPEDVRTAFTVTLDDTMQTGNHTLYSCKVGRILGDETREALYAWEGYSVIGSAQMGSE